MRRCMLIVCSSDPLRAYSRRIVRSIVLPGAVSRDLDPPAPSIGAKVHRGRSLLKGWRGAISETRRRRAP
jgi:hypothetical protein